MTSAQELIERMKRPQGWLPGVGNIVNVTFLPAEAELIIQALRRLNASSPPTDSGSVT